MPMLFEWAMEHQSLVSKEQTALWNTVFKRLMVNNG